MFKKCIRSLFLQEFKLYRRYNVTCSPLGPSEAATRITILPNGVRIATEYLQTSVACMSLFVEAGPRFESVRNNGISHFIEHMAYKGLCDTSQQQLEQFVLLSGANAHVTTSREIQIFTINCLSEYAPNMVDTLSNIICQLEVSSGAIDAEKLNMCLEMEDEDNDPRATTFDYLHQTAFQGTPLSQRVIGPSRNISQFDRNTVLHFLRQHYQPYKLCLAAAGGVRHDDIVRYAEDKLGNLVGESVHQSDDGPCRFTGSQITYRDDSMPFAHVAIAFEAPGFTSPEYLTLLVASNMMGKWHRSQGLGLANASPLAQAAAVEGICESFESFYIAYRDVGLWGVYYVAKRMDLEDMLERIQNQWMHLCITTQHLELERAVNITKLDLARAVSGVHNTCRDIGAQVMYFCTRKSLADKLNILSSIKVSAIRASAEGVLYDRCPAVVAVGPTENLPEYTRIRAGQYWLRL